MRHHRRHRVHRALARPHAAGLRRHRLPHEHRLRLPAAQHGVTHNASSGKRRVLRLDAHERHRASATSLRATSLLVRIPRSWPSAAMTRPASTLAAESCLTPAATLELSESRTPGRGRRSSTVRYPGAVAGRGAAAASAVMNGGVSTLAGRSVGLGAADETTTSSPELDREDRASPLRSSSESPSSGGDESSICGTGRAGSGGGGSCSSGRLCASASLSAASALSAAASMRARKARRASPLMLMLS